MRASWWLKRDERHPSLEFWGNITFSKPQYPHAKCWPKVSEVFCTGREKFMFLCSCFILTAGVGSVRLPLSALLSLWNCWCSAVACVAGCHWRACWDLAAAIFPGLIPRITEDWRWCLRGQEKPPGQVFKAPETAAALWATVPRARHLSRGITRARQPVRTRMSRACVGKQVSRDLLSLSGSSNLKPVVLNQTCLDSNTSSHSCVSTKAYSCCMCFSLFPTIYTVDTSSCLIHKKLIFSNLYIICHSFFHYCIVYIPTFSLYFLLISLNFILHAFLVQCQIAFPCPQYLCDLLSCNLQ